MSDSPDLTIVAENLRTGETVFSEFERSEAHALVRLIRGLKLDDCRSKSVSDEDAQLMLDGLAKLQRFFVAAGVAPW